MNKEPENPIDLSGVDPTRDAARFTRIVDGVMRAAASELRSRRASNNVVGQLAQWRRPVLVAAAASAAFLVFSFSSVMAPELSADENPGIAEAIGIPSEFAQWIRGDAQPSVTDIYEGLAGQ